MVLAAVIERFLAGQRIGPSHLLVACSGGTDSTALLAALADFRERGYRVTCAHVNHHLRGAESNEDEAFVRRICADLGIPLEVADGTCDPEAVRHRGVESAAREVRLKALADIRARCEAAFIATAHQLDDQAETLLMRLVTGSGIERLRGIAPRTRDGFLRPLLTVSRHEIEAFLAARGLAGHSDSSNSDRRFLRNRVRHDLLPLLRDWNPRILETLAQTAEQAGAIVDLLEPLIEGASERAVTRGPDSTAFNVKAMPDNRWLRSALIHREIRRLDEAAREVSALDLARLSEALATAGRISVTRNLELVRRGPDAVLQKRARAFEEGPPAPFAYEHDLDAGNTVEVPGARLTLRRLQDAASPDDLSRSQESVRVFSRGTPSAQRPLSAASQLFQLPPGSRTRFVIRNRRPGDRFRPLGLAEEKRLNRFLIDRKIPRDDRERLPLLLWNGRIVWVAGVAVSDEFRVTDSPGDLYEVTWECK